MRPLRRYPGLTLCLLAALAISGCQTLHDQFRGEQNSNSNASQRQAQVPQSVHLPFGNPSKASPDPASENDFLIVGQTSVISYNNARGTANWVAWKTTREDLSDSIPRPDFRPDPRLPKWYKRIGYYDYSGSGYNRGHLVPSADRFRDPRLHEETFMMTNIVPQSGSLNQYPWNDFEQYVRAQVRKGFDAYQLAGVYGEALRIKGKITAPTNCWKVVVLMPRGKDPSTIDERTRVIAVDMPNEDGLEHEKWGRFRTTPKAIEQRTGLDLFSALPKELQRELETRMETVSR